MRLLFTGLLEMLRALLIFMLLYLLFGAVSNYLLEMVTNRTISQLTEEHSYMMNFLVLQAIGVAIIIFILYRNKFQFSGWYKGKQVKRLSKTTTRILVASSVVFIFAMYIVVGFAL
ncbi:hypothetical protein [Virgibacillus proomii]|uniref:hypothetical protein n=1 Tax=Virgibacillus proomii TaxID=84407 RepID=UPI001C115BC1|nr:hypothetical protein [Virgibacillus proomii]MBU5268232.1 hypothetical protein [Virgibacillus proomii]